MKRKKIARYIAVSLIMLAVAALYVYKEYNRANKSTVGLRPDYSVAASSIIKDFESNDSLAGKKYTDKIILVEGIIKEILKDDRGFYSVMLGDTTSMSSVKCSMDSTYYLEVIGLQKGENAAVKGVCAGFNADELLGSDVILVRCVVDRKNK